MRRRANALSPGTRREYSRRIEAALRLIEENLDADMTLSRLAAEANFSAFHFHRIFSAMVGESPAEYVRRLRLEKAAMLLLVDPSRRITDIALSCGFSTSALFCRLFKARFRASPSQWRARSEMRKNRQQARKKGKDSSRPAGSHWSQRNDPGRTTMRKRPAVTVEEVAPFRVAYVKHARGYRDSAGISEAFEKLFAWAGPRGFLGPQMRVLGMPLDDPEITPEDKCRYRACVSVSERARPEGEVNVMSVRPGAYAIGRFSGSRDVFSKAYAYMYGEWLPRSGYLPDDAPGFECYLGEPEGTRPRFEFDLYIPLKKM